MKCLQPETAVTETQLVAIFPRLLAMHSLPWHWPETPMRQTLKHKFKSLHPVLIENQYLTMTIWDPICLEISVMKWILGLPLFTRWGFLPSKTPCLMILSGSATTSLLPVTLDLLPRLFQIFQDHCRHVFKQLQIFLWLELILVVMGNQLVKFRLSSRDSSRSGLNKSKRMITFMVLARPSWII